MNCVLNAQVSTLPLVALYTCRHSNLYCNIASSLFLHLLPKLNLNKRFYENLNLYREKNKVVSSECIMFLKQDVEIIHDYSGI